MAPGLTSRGDFSIALLPLSGLLVQPLGVYVWVVAFVPSHMTLASPESSRKWYHLVEVRLGCSRSQQGQIIFLKRCRVSKACAWKYQKFTGPFRWVCQLAVGSLTSPGTASETWAPAAIARVSHCSLQQAPEGSHTFSCSAPCVPGRDKLRCPLCSFLLSWCIFYIFLRINYT